MKCKILSALFLLTLISVVFICGCTTTGSHPIYMPSLVIPSPENNGVVANYNKEIFFKADAYFDVERQKQILDAKMTKKGILPIYVEIDNNSDYSVRIEKVILRISNDLQIDNISTEKVVEKCGTKSSSTLTPLALISPITALMSKPTVDNRTSDTNRSMADYLTLNKLEYGELLSKDMKKGFVFFEFPKDKKDIKNFILIANLKNIITGNDFTIEANLMDNH